MRVSENISIVNFPVKYLSNLLTIQLVEKGSAVNRIIHIRSSDIIKGIIPFLIENESNKFQFFVFNIFTDSTSFGEILFCAYTQSNLFNEAKGLTAINNIHADNIRSVIIDNYRSASNEISPFNLMSVSQLLIIDNQNRPCECGYSKSSECGNSSTMSIKPINKADCICLDTVVFFYTLRCIIFVFALLIFW